MSRKIRSKSKIETQPGCVVRAYQALLQLLLVSLDVFGQLCLGSESLSTAVFDVAFESLLYRYTLGQAGAIENMGDLALEITTTLSLRFSSLVSSCFLPQASFQN